MFVSKFSSSALKLRHGSNVVPINGTCSKQPQLSLLIKENERLFVSLGLVKKLRHEFSRFCCDLETFGFGFFIRNS